MSYESKPERESRKCILLVDDDPDTVRVLKQSLKEEGFDTVIVTDGNSAAKFTDKIKPDVIILDEIKPGRDDVRAVDLIRKHSDVPIIMLSQEYGMDALRRAFLHGADDYIQKPFGLSVLVARVRAKIRRTGYGKKFTYAHRS